MRAKPMLWGAALAIAFSSTTALASVVVVKSLGPSSKVYPPGKTLSESAKINLVGGDPYGGSSTIDQAFIWRPFANTMGACPIPAGRASARRDSPAD